MKSIELLSTGIKLLGIYVFLSSFRTGINQYQAIIQFQLMSEDDTDIAFYVSIGLVAFMIAAAFVMFKFPTTIAKWILPKTKDNEVSLDGSAKDIEVSLFSVIGVYILSWAIPDFVYNGIWWWYSSYSQLNNMWGSGGGSEYIIDQIVTILEIAIGLYLCLRSEGLSHLLRKFRQAGSK